MPRKVPVRVIEDDEILTQYGQVGFHFHNEPRWHIEEELSICAQSHTVQESCRCVTRSTYHPDMDTARWTTAGTLRANGFVVEHAPTKRNPHHAQVKFSGVWDEDVCEAFDKSFEIGGPTHG